MTPETKIYVKLGGRKYKLPVNPEEIEVKHSTVDRTENVVGVGEILIPQKPGLREISWSGFLPGSPLDPYVDSYKSPRTLAKAFEKAWKKRSKCRLIISRSNNYDTNLRCVISEWSCTDKGGEPDDLYYSVTFREVRAYGVQQLTVVSTTGPGAALSGGDSDSSGGSSSSSGPGASSSDAVLVVAADAVRPVEEDVLVVGASVQISGPYYSDSTGLVQVGEASGLTAKITRIEDGTACPYRVGSIGWMRKDPLSFPGGGS